MQPTIIETKLGRVTLRQAELTDIVELIALNKICFPAMAEENVVWRKGQIQNHLRVFPDGQLVAEREDGKLVGAVASLVVDLGLDPYRAHTYAGVTDGGYFHNHDPDGDSLYGADVYVHPDMRGAGIGHHLYEARRALCKRLNLRRIIAGGRIDGYSDHSSTLTPEQYIKKVEVGSEFDSVLSFQLREGFVVRGVLRNYITDPKSKNCATFLEWKNPDYVPGRTGERKLRVAAVQYQVRKIQSFDDFAAQVEYFVETASEYRADFVLFPEFFSVQLLSQPDLQKLPSVEGIERLSALEGEYLNLMSGLAQRYGLYIIGGTHPMRRGKRTFNMCPFFFPDGRYVLQPKIHITPAEKKYWGISGGDDVLVVHTPKAKIGINICYDAEFPEYARYLADQGVEILFVPYCTDDRQGFYRVRYCCQARAIENQIYVVTAGIIGNLPSVPAMDIHYGRAAVFTPSDFHFARDGIQAEADSNVETLLVTDLDIEDLYRARAAGSVTPRLDRRSDLFEFRTSVKTAGELVLEEAPRVGIEEQ